MSNTVPSDMHSDFGISDKLARFGNLYYFLRWMITHVGEPETEIRTWVTSFFKAGTYFCANRDVSEVSGDDDHNTVTLARSIEDTHRC